MSCIASNSRSLCLQRWSKAIPKNEATKVLCSEVLHQQEEGVFRKSAFADSLDTPFFGHILICVLHFIRLKRQAVDVAVRQLQ